jgi:amidase
MRKGEMTRRGALAGGVALAAASGTAGLAATPDLPITQMDAVDLSAAIHSRQVSCVEVMAAYLDRIDRLNAHVNAIVALQDRGTLMEQARLRDAQLARGQSMGWMHGFPHAIKDLENTQGIVSTQGSPIYKDFVPAQDGYMVARIRKAGAIFIGKTNAPEFGLGSQTYNQVYGTTLNAYDQTKTSGGSSGGASVALALRLVPVADGSDYAGSLRNPSAWNNIFGLRPAIGRVARSNDSFLPSLGVMGPLARTVPDLAMLLSVQAGFDPRDTVSIRQDPAIFTQTLERDFKGTRIAWFGDYKGYLPFEPGVLPLCRQAFKTFEHLGCTVEEVTPDFPMHQVWEDFVTLRAWQNAVPMRDLYKDPAKRALLKPEAIWEIERGMTLSADDISRASARRHDWYLAMVKLFERYDFVLTPSAQVFPFDAGLHWPKAINGHAMDSYHRWMEVVAPITMSGCPALNIPVGFNQAGLPMGMQLVGRHQDELSCLQLAHAYDSQTMWVKKNPPALSI